MLEHSKHEPSAKNCQSLDNNAGSVQHSGLKDDLACTGSQTVCIETTMHARIQKSNRSALQMRSVVHILLTASWMQKLVGEPPLYCLAWAQTCEQVPFCAGRAQVEALCSLGPALCTDSA